MQRKLILLYYAATAVFLSLDYGFGVNVRVAVLDTAPGLRFAYYVLCFACLALMLWRPAWTTIIGTVESLLILVALILNMALRSMVITHPLLASGPGVVTIEEVLNFVIAGGAAYVSWASGMAALGKDLQR